MLTPDEAECYKMFRLWKDWNTKPWEVNGGFVYPEDITAVLKMDEFQRDAERMQREKEEAKQRMKSRKR